MGYAAKLGGKGSGGGKLIDIPYEKGLYVRGYTSNTGGSNQSIPTQGYKYIKMTQQDFTGTVTEYLTDGTSRTLGTAIANVTTILQLSDDSYFIRVAGPKSQSWNYCYFGLYAETVPT